MYIVDYIQSAFILKSNLKIKSTFGCPQNSFVLYVSCLAVLLLGSPIDLVI